MVFRADSPFTADVMEKPLPDKFKMPAMDSFDDTTDPVDHLDSYNSFMTLHAVPDEIMCRAFPTTLKASARIWYSKLSPKSISNFKQLSQAFVGHFIGAQRHRKPATYLVTVKQRHEETLRNFVSRFNAETLQCDGVDD